MKPSAIWPRVMTAPALEGSGCVARALLWREGPLCGARDVGWVFKGAFHGPSAARPAHSSLLSQIHVQGLVKGRPPGPAVNLPLAFRQADKREAVGIFTPALQTCGPCRAGLLSCVPRGDSLGVRFLSPTAARCGPQPRSCGFTVVEERRSSG